MFPPGLARDLHRQSRIGGNDRLLTLDSDADVDWLVQSVIAHGFVPRRDDSPY
jgi:hypothetical protein